MHERTYRGKRWAALRAMANMFLVLLHVGKIMGLVKMRSDIGCRCTRFSPSDVSIRWMELATKLPTYALSYAFIRFIVRQISFLWDTPVLQYKYLYTSFIICMHMTTVVWHTRGVRSTSMFNFHFWYNKCVLRAWNKVLRVLEYSGVCHIVGYATSLTRISDVM